MPRRVAKGRPELGYELGYSGPAWVRTRIAYSGSEALELRATYSPAQLRDRRSRDATANMLCRGMGGKALRRLLGICGNGLEASYRILAHEEVRAENQIFGREADLEVEQLAQPSGVVERLDAAVTE